jgi:acetyltransferase-like isoleucine patch superfamily enzyme
MVYLRVRSWGEGANLQLGAYCSIAEKVTIILGGNHRTDWVTTYPFSALWDSARHIEGHPTTKGDVIIGNDVWIGSGATILSGVTIGDGAVVGAMSLVTQSVPPYGIVGGNPARLLGKRFNDHTIERLIALHWWNWDRETIEHFIPLMLNRDIEAFLCQAEKYQKIE